MAKSRLEQVFNILHKTYNDQGWWPIKGVYDPALKHRSKTKAEQFEIAVGAILTQNTSWTNVEKALTELRSKKMLNSKRINQASHEELAQTIKSSGYHNQKARKLKEFVTKFKEPNREHLLALSGIGPETADSILLYAHDQPTFVIDTYTKRLISRLGIIDKEPKDIDYHQLQNIFHNKLPKDHKVYNEFHALIVEHAKQHCTKKPKCTGCPLKNSCKTGKSKKISN